MRVVFRLYAYNKEQRTEKFEHQLFIFVFQHQMWVISNFISPCVGVAEERRNKRRTGGLTRKASRFGSFETPSSRPDDRWAMLSIHSAVSLRREARQTVKTTTVQRTVKSAGHNTCRTTVAPCGTMESTAAESSAAA